MIREQINILAVDDDAEDLRLLKWRLSKVEEFDYAIVTASSGEVALDLLSSRLDSFDICLMDLRLGAAKSGTDVIAVCEKLGYRLPFLILTGFHADSVDMRKAAGLSLCLGFVSKEILVSEDEEELKRFDQTIRFAIQKFKQQNRSGHPQMTDERRSL